MGVPRPFHSCVITLNLLQPFSSSSEKGGIELNLLKVDTFNESTTAEPRVSPTIFAGPVDPRKEVRQPTPHPPPQGSPLANNIWIGRARRCGRALRALEVHDFEAPPDWLSIAWGASDFDCKLKTTKLSLPGAGQLGRLFWEVLGWGLSFNRIIRSN